jgi:DNA-binding MarR family transcriptional regulator
MNPIASPTDQEFEDLLAFRDGLRRFMQWSSEQAREVGLTPAQHQLLLAVRGHGSTPTVGDLAAHLLLRHHSAVELIDRAERLDLVRRHGDPNDARVVRVVLTTTGERLLEQLSPAHLEELRQLRHRSVERRGNAPPTLG